MNTAKPGLEPGFVVLVAPSGSYRIAPYVRAAKQLGMQILVVSNSAHSLVSEVAKGITVDFTDPDQAFALIVDALLSKNVMCILATDDSCVALCSGVANHFGLAQNSITAALLTQRKDLGRDALKKAGRNHPDYQLITLSAIEPGTLTIEFPIVVKPLGLSASRGVIRANNKNEFIAACDRIEIILEKTGITGFNRNNLLVEAYIDGDEFAVEGFICNGKFHLLTIFDKPEPLTGPFFEETYYLTPSQLNQQLKARLVDEVAACCQAYGLEQGPVHAEARITADGKVVLIELAARTIGGQCGQLLEFSLGQKLEEIIIQGLCGQLPAASEQKHSAGVLMIPVTKAGILQRIEGMTEALQVPYIKDLEIHIAPGYELIPLPEGSSYLGFIFAQAPDYKHTYQALKDAYAKLHFVTRPKWTLEPLVSG
ncbi:MAG: biotin carboxylase [Gammaproteobacteria bacterium]|jgi:biotin carboxylase